MPGELHAELGRLQKNNKELQEELQVATELIRACLRTGGLRTDSTRRLWDAIQAFLSNRDLARVCDAALLVRYRAALQEIADSQAVVSGGVAVRLQNAAIEALEP